MFTRRSILALFLFALTAPVVAQEIPAVYFYIRKTDRGNDYKAGDIVQTLSAYRADGTKRRCVIPPADQNHWLVQVQGITPQEAEQYMMPATNPDGSLRVKRAWGIRTNLMPKADREFMITNGYLGYGGDYDLYGALVLEDRVLQWSEFQTWLVNK